MSDGNAPILNTPAWLQCEGKEPFASAMLAALVAKRRNRSKARRLKATQRQLSSYRCVHCGFFHIGGVFKPW